jgi:hypothetical protein
MLLEFMTAEEAKKESDEARKHYREEERMSLLKSVHASITDACKHGWYDVTVEVPDEDVDFLYDYLKEKGYALSPVTGEAVNVIGIHWD